ncbi:MAG: DUF2914 domain-containing protein [Bdellovibrionales bacterium]|jgi:hypothetical protein|nr:DUF2914 domain-containing protein [Bdellovibrionales bacterium]
MTDIKSNDSNFGNTPPSLSDKVKKYVEENETKLEVGFFVGGFILDVFLLSTPDDFFGIIQQLIYMTIVGSLLHFEVLYRLRKYKPGPRVKKFWQYRSLLLHFSFGSLLNLYSLFYIKSASLMSSFIFLIVMLALVLANELPFVKKASVASKVAMYAICLFSFFSILLPIGLGFVGWIPFLLAVGLTGLAFFLHVRLLEKSFTDRRLLHRAMLYPSGTILTVFSLFYVLGWIPPVPLSVVEQGVYHSIEKKSGQYILSFEKPWWKFWQTSDRPFRAIPGDKLYFYAQIYSPTRISDSVVIHWLTKNQKGKWVSSDKVPMSIQGGREMGFRGFSYKSNYTPGEWQIRVETSGGIEISRHYVDVEASTDGIGVSREFVQAIR